jgi:hypothetical protein
MYNFERELYGGSVDLDAEISFERGTQEYESFANGLMQSNPARLAKSYCLKVLNRALIINDEISSVEVPKIFELAIEAPPKKLPSDAAGRAMQHLRQLCESFFTPERLQGLPQRSAKLKRLL